jgi:hypothetical protein
MKTLRIILFFPALFLILGLAVIIVKLLWGFVQFVWNLW